MSLFEDDPHDFRDRLLDAYAQELLAHPPVRSVTNAPAPDGEPDPAKRLKNAQAIARKDVRRFFDALDRSRLTTDQVSAVRDIYKDLKR